MENAADALKTTFAIFVFIIALSIAFSLISDIKQTADVILYEADETSYYDWLEGDLKERKNSRRRHSYCGFI